MEDEEQGESSKGPSCYFDPQSQNLKEKSNMTCISRIVAGA
jgi:hypothetical protein